MSEEFKLDKLDIQILNILITDSRKSFQDIARELIVSGGTIHVRVNKLKEAGVITGSHLAVDFSKLGLEVCAFIGVNLVNAGAYSQVLSTLREFPEVVDLHYTTGQYSMFIKILVSSTKELHLFLTDKLQTISDIRSTETFISLDNPIYRSGSLPIPKET